jgi:hypothetical protein
MLCGSRSPIRQRRVRASGGLLSSDSGLNAHAACVDAWMTRVGRDAPPPQLLRAFEQAFAALWKRALPTLGEVTLSAIVDRVLTGAAETFPPFATLDVDASGLRLEELKGREDGMERERLAAGLRSILVEFLTVVGYLTAELLTPSLHAELSSVPKP